MRFRPGSSLELGTKFGTKSWRAIPRSRDGNAKPTGRWTVAATDGPPVLRPSGLPASRVVADVNQPQTSNPGP